MHDAALPQETKLAADMSPPAEIEAAGWQVAFHGRNTYDGCAHRSRAAVPVDAMMPLPDVTTRRRAWLRPELVAPRRLVPMGDFGTGPEVLDVHDPVARPGQIHCTPEERAHFGDVTGRGLRIDIVQLGEALQLPPCRRAMAPAA